VDVLGASLLVVWSEKIDEATDASVAEFVSATEGEERSETSEERSEE
jgi:hypothetical protein